MTTARPELDAFDQPTPQESRWLIAIVLIGLVLRILLLITKSADLQTDPDAYVALAETIVETGGFHSPGTTHPTAFRPPFYPLVLASLMWVGLKSSVAVSLLHLFSGAIVTIATWWIARVIGLRGFWAAGAAAATALDPLLLRYTVLPMTEVPAAALLAVAVLQTLKLRPVDTSVTGVPSQRPVKSAVVAGIFFGLAGLCRPVCFLACAVLTIALFLQHALSKTQGGESTTKNRWIALVPAGVAGVLLLPWVVRNAVQFREFIPLTTHGGYTLLLGNNETFYNDVALAVDDSTWSNHSFEQWQQQLQQDLTAEQVAGEHSKDRWMYDRAVSSIRSHPAAFVKASLLRWRRFWAVQPQVEGSSLSGWAMLGVGGWYLIQWFGLLGAALAIRRNPGIQLLWLSIAAFLMLHSFYWTNARMRAPLTAVIVVLMVAGWQKLNDARHKKSSHGN